ncbi:FUSC family protein [Rothia sp. LK2588]|uniref:FUSC family protein n=1 Tax=Rothia sp. LK2588 TaxID=3114369 RepID=UPI0034CD3AAF
MGSSENSPVQRLLHVPPHVVYRDTLPAVRIAISVGIPLVILLALGEPKLTIFTAFGAFSSMYGRMQPLRGRMIQQGASGALMTLCVGVGLALSAGHVAGAALVLCTSVVSALCAYVAMLLNLKPSGPLFYIFASAAIASVPYSGHALRDVALTAGSAALSLVLGVILGELFREGRAHHPAPRTPLDRRTMLTQTLTNFLTVAAAGLAGNLMGLSHAYWAMVAAAAVLAGPTTSDRVIRGVHRVVGTLLGVLVTAFFVSMNPDAWHVAVLVVVAQLVTEIFVMRNYGIAAIFITPLALLMLHLAAPFSSYELLTLRMIETAVGVAVGLLGAVVSPGPEHLGKDTVAIPVVRAARHWRQ